MAASVARRRFGRYGSCVSWTLRSASVADAPVIAAVHVEGWRWGYRGLLPPDLVEVSVPEREALWSRALAPASQTAVLVAEIGGEVVAFAAFGPPLDDADGATAELYALYQREACAGTGVGAALLAATCGAMGRAGHRRAALWVLERNARARAFYERHGWSADGATTSEERAGVPLVDVRYVRALGEGDPRD